MNAAPQFLLDWLEATYGYDKSVDNGASFYGEDSGHCALFFADYENPVFDGTTKKSAQEELNLNTENSGE